MSDPDALAKKAVESGEIDRLLLAAPEYQFRSRWSPAPGETDLTELLVPMYRLPDHAKVRAELLSALYRIMGEYEGLVPVASTILFEVGERKDGRPLGLPIEDLAEKLSQSVEKYRVRLSHDKRASEGADQWPDGLYGELKRLSRNSQSYGGPGFVNEK